MTKKRVFRVVKEIMTDLFLLEEDIDPAMPLDDVLTDADDTEQLVYELEDEFGVSVGFQLAHGELTTVGELVEYIWEEV